MSEETGDGVVTGEALLSFMVQAEAPPLREDAAGALRIGASRVLLIVACSGEAEWSGLIVYLPL